MAITTSTDDLNIIAALDDEPNDVGGLSAAQLKAKFDEGANALQTFINGTHIPELDAEHIPYLYGGADTIKSTMEGLTVGVMPDESVTTAKLADGSVTADKFSVDALSSVRSESLLRDLNIMLNLSLGMTNINSWADLLDDTSGINTEESDNFTLDSGKITSANLIKSSETYSSTIQLTGSTGWQKLGQSFKATATGEISAVKVLMRNSHTPTDGVIVKLLSGSNPSTATLLATSEEVNTTSMSSDFQMVAFTFTGGVSLTADNYYCIVLERTGAVDNTNCYTVGLCAPTTYSDGQEYHYDGSLWESFSKDVCFSIVPSTGTVVWNSVTAAEAFVHAAICADETLNTGSITYYLSDDGTNWTEITALDTAQAVDFEGTSVYLKVVITGDAELLGVAWGGY